LNRVEGVGCSSGRATNNVGVAGVGVHSFLAYPSFKSLASLAIIFDNSAVFDSCIIIVLISIHLLSTMYSNNVDWGHTLVQYAPVAIPVLTILYVASLYLYRLYLHPLAGYPGPKLAAISNWYEFYYDVIQHGKFTAHIQELHEEYGMYHFILSAFFPINVCNCVSW
jgi:hypothetical protein